MRMSAAGCAVVATYSCANIQYILLFSINAARLRWQYGARIDIVDCSHAGGSLQLDAHLVGVRPRIADELESGRRAWSASGCSKDAAFGGCRRPPAYLYAGASPVLLALPQSNFSNLSPHAAGRHGAGRKGLTRFVEGHVRVWEGGAGLSACVAAAESADGAACIRTHMSQPLRRARVYLRKYTCPL